MRGVGCQSELPLEQMLATLYGTCNWSAVPVSTSTEVGVLLTVRCSALVCTPYFVQKPQTAKHGIECGLMHVGHYEQHLMKL